MNLVKGLLGAAAVMLLGGAAAKANEIPSMNLKYASVLPQGNAVSDVDEYFVKKLDELSGGKIKAQIFWTRALGKADEMLPMIEAGAVDFTMLETGQYSETPFLGMMNALPMVHFDDGEVVRSAYDLYQNSEALKKELENIGARIALVRPSPGYYLLCKASIESLADFRGKKLRAYGPYVPLMWEALGAVPVNVPSNELYEALDKGVIDCAYLPPSFLAAFKLHEVAKNYIDFSFGNIELAPVVVPDVVWNQWPSGVQEIVGKATRDTEAWGADHIARNAADSIDVMVAAGARKVALKDADAVKAAIPDMIDIWVKRQTDAGRGEQAALVAAQVRKALGR